MTLIDSRIIFAIYFLAENGNPPPVNHIEPVKTYVYTANGQFVAEMGELTRGHLIKEDDCPARYAAFFSC